MVYLPFEKLAYHFVGSSKCGFSTFPVIKYHLVKATCTKFLFCFTVYKLGSTNPRISTNAKYIKFILKSWVSNAFQKCIDFGETALSVDMSLKTMLNFRPMHNKAENENKQKKKQLKNVRFQRKNLLMVSYSAVAAKLESIHFTEWLICIATICYHL